MAYTSLTFDLVADDIEWGFVWVSLKAGITLGKATVCREVPEQVDHPEHWHFEALKKFLSEVGKTRKVSWRDWAPGGGK